MGKQSAWAKTKVQISFAVTAKLISTFVFVTRIVRFLYFVNRKLQASNHLCRTWLEPKLLVFSSTGSILVLSTIVITFLQNSISQTLSLALAAHRSCCGRKKLELENISQATVYRPVNFSQQPCIHKKGQYECRRTSTLGGSRGGEGGPDPPWNCQIINFCHVEIFRQTPSGNLDPP